MKVIRSGDESKSLAFSFFDYNNDPVIPVSVTWSAYCVTTEAVLQASTSVTPNYTIVIQLNSNLVTLQDLTNKRELKRVCIIAVDSDGNSLPEQYEYEVVPFNNCG